MKKLMVAAVAMAMAVAANAATTAWGIPYAEEDFAKTGTPNEFAGGTAFLFMLTGEGVAPTFENGAWNLNGATQLDLANYDPDMMAWGPQDTSSAANLVDTAFTGADQYYAIVLTSAETTDLATFVGDDKYAAIVTGTTTYEAGTEAEGGATFMYVNAAYADIIEAGGWQSVAAVPEPTSGLLLLLGVAGLALRRRRA